MIKDLTVKEIIDITGGTLVYGNENDICKSFIKDTNLIENNDVFVGFKGSKFDGGSLYKKAFEKGAKGCVINETSNEQIEKFKDKFVIVVKDTVKAIGQIAKLKRAKYDIPVIAITGSVGKTSTKDIIASVVSEKFNVLKTQGNMNNNIGLPMTILGLRNHDAMVVEMGMNHLGEISYLTDIARPTIAIITNVGTAHIGNLGSRENILKAKLEILEGLDEDGKIIINNDNDLLHRWNNEYHRSLKNNFRGNNVVTYGIKNDSDEMAINIKYIAESSAYTLKENKNIEKVTDIQNIIVPVGGEAFVYNSLAAISVGKILEISMEDIKKGIKKFELTKMRLDIEKSSNGYIIINDCYNANYDSMKSAIEYLNKSEGKRKIAVLGDMLELGEFSAKLHEMVGEELARNCVDVLITVGKESENIAKVAEKKEIITCKYKSNAEAIKKLKEIIKKDDVILIKASNSMNFKEIADAIRK